ncbi:MAG: helix-turn-helix transcriptional regulator [Acidobacteriota bacterium]
MHDEMKGRPTEKEAPLFGQRLSEARRAKGWTQAELADALDTNVKMIDYYERRAVNPALEVVQACAKVLDVSASYLVGADDEPRASKKRTGPVSPLERKFQQVKKLPKKKQEFILQFLDTVLENNQQKA